MKRYSYGERDYAFGQLMLTLRTHIDLTQAGLAELLHVSRRAVAEWEAGSAYPKAEHLKELIALGVRASAFPAGREAEEIRALWKAAHQKVLLDESWLAALLGRPRPALTLLPPVPLEEPQRGEEISAAQPPAGRRVDWGEALAVPSFYDREREVAQLTAWVTQERCRVVSVLGLGGIGKSALAVSLMHQVAPHFEVVVFRSLRDAPECSALLEDCLQVLAPQPLREAPTSLERRLGLLLDYLRTERVLLVLDNLEVLLEEGEGTGRMRAGYEDYGRLLRQVAQTAHQSCLLLTSREKPRELVALEGSRTPVRSLRLAGLDAVAGSQLLAEKDVAGTTPERARLIEAYAGNPLALKIVAETIVELFGGEIAPFLEQGEVVFGSVRQLLDEQFARLSADEQTVLLWLAILREPVSIEEVLAAKASPLSRAQVLDALETLRRRSLIERGQRRGSFTLQSVVLEYATARLIAEAASEIEQGNLSRLIEHGLALATAREYVRQTQQRLIVAPILALLRSSYQQRDALEQQLFSLLAHLRTQADYAQGYGPANVLALLLLQRGHLRDLYLSRLALRGVHLQGVEMQDANLAGATLRDSVFTETFDVITALAISPSGQYWAAASGNGEVRLWREEGQTLHRVWQAHTDSVWTLAFSPDERLLTSGSFDGSVKLWDVESRALLWSDWQTKEITCLAFSPEGDLLASGDVEATVRLWGPKLGTPLQELPHPRPVYSLAWSPDGRRLASGDVEGTIRLWEVQKSQRSLCVQTLEGHSSLVRGLAFAPGGGVLASASWDGSIKLWEVGETGSGRCLETLVGQTDKVKCVAWSPDGHLLASDSFDHTIRLWDVEQGTSQVALQGHTAVVNGLAFTPDSRRLLSSSNDGTLRLWEVESSQCVRLIQGFAAPLLDLDWSPDGTQLATAGPGTLLTVWDATKQQPLKELRGHSWIVHGVAWGPDGQLLASGGWDNAVRVWDAITGEARQIFWGLGGVDTVFCGVAWSPDGKFLASGTSQQGVYVWEVTTAILLWLGQTDPAAWIRRVAWSPDGRRLASGGADGSVCLWESSDGRLLQRLAGHQGGVNSVAWSPDGTRLASGGVLRDKGELFVWDAQTGARLSSWHEPSAKVYTLAWSPGGAGLLSGGSDGMLRWWDLPSGECVRVCKAHQGTIQALKVSPDGRRLASGGDDGTIRLWDLESGQSLGTLRRDRPYERLTITGIRGLTQAQKATLRALGAVEDEADEQSSRPEQAAEL